MIQGFLYFNTDSQSTHWEPEAFIDLRARGFQIPMLDLDSGSEPDLYMAAEKMMDALQPICIYIRGRQALSAPLIRLLERQNTAEKEMFFFADPETPIQEFFVLKLQIKRVEESLISEQILKIF